MLLSRVVSREGMEGVRSLGARRLKDRCEFTRVAQQTSAFGGNSNRDFQVVGQSPCDVVPRTTTTGGTDNQSRVTGRFDLHLPPSTHLDLSWVVWSPGYIPDWSPNTYYELGALVRVPREQAEFGDGWYYRCVLAGTSGEESPFGDTAPLGHALVDGSMSWQRAGRLFVLQPTGDEISALSNQGSLVVDCKVVT